MFRTIIRGIWMPFGDSEIDHYKKLIYSYLLIKSDKRSQLVLSALKGDRMGYM